jgi:hypothetical protein
MTKVLMKSPIPLGQDTQLTDCKLHWSELGLYQTR